MNNLFKAIYSQFTTTPHNDFYDGLNGRLYYGTAPQECNYPYSVYFGVTSTPEDTFGEEIDEITFQFNIYSGNNSSVEVGDLLNKCRTLYDKSVLEVVGSRDVCLEREFSTPPYLMDDVWICSIEFSLLIQQ